MKKLFLVSVIFSFIISVNEIQSQNLVSQVDVSEIEIPTTKRNSTSSSLNAVYLKESRHSNISKHIEEMRLKVANFNCKESRNFNGQSQLYKVNFKSEKGNILAFFDQNGKIVRTEENFENIKIPQAVRETVFNSYENWILTAVKFHSEYNREESTTNYYKVWITNGKSKKVLKVNSEGEVL